MKKKDLEHLLKTESENLDMQISDKVLGSPIQEKSPFHTEKSRKSGNKLWKMSFVGVCALLLVVVGIFTLLPENVVSASDLTSYILEINPIVCITADSSNEVVSICSLNENGDILLSDQNFEDVVGNKLEDCLKAIIDVSVREGYFENYDRNITVFAVNNKESFAIEKSGTFESLLRTFLEENNLSDIQIVKGCMSIDDFKEKMGFDNNFNDLEE